MSLLQYVKIQFIRQAVRKLKHQMHIWRAFNSRIYLNCSKVFKSFPLPDDEHLFALFWNIHDGHKLSATFLSQPYPFCYEKEFVAGTRTQLHSHEYLEFFYVMEGEYHQKILGTEYIFPLAVLLDYKIVCIRKF